MDGRGTRVGSLHGRWTRHSLAHMEGKKLSLTTTLGWLQTLKGGMPCDFSLCVHVYILILCMYACIVCVYVCVVLCCVCIGLCSSVCMFVLCVFACVLLCVYAYVVCA